MNTLFACLIVAGVIGAIYAAYKFVVDLKKGAQGPAPVVPHEWTVDVASEATPIVESNVMEAASFNPQPKVAAVNYTGFHLVSPGTPKMNVLEPGEHVFTLDLKEASKVVFVAAKGAGNEALGNVKLSANGKTGGTQFTVDLPAGRNQVTLTNAVKGNIALKYAIDNKPARPSTNRPAPPSRSR